MDYIFINGELYHHGVKGMKWGVRRWQNADGSLTAAGRRRMYKDAKAVIKNDLDASILENVYPRYIGTGSRESYKVFKEKGDTSEAWDNARKASEEYAKKLLGKYGDKKLRKLEPIDKDYNKGEKNLKLYKYLGHIMYVRGAHEYLNERDASMTLDRNERILTAKSNGKNIFDGVNKFNSEKSSVITKVNIGANKNVEVRTRINRENGTSTEAYRKGCEAIASNFVKTYNDQVNRSNIGMAYPDADINNAKLVEIYVDPTHDYARSIYKLSENNKSGYGYGTSYTTLSTNHVHGPQLD